jgi:hypothetical protein
VRKHGATYANRSKKIYVHQALRLFGGDSFRQAREVVAGIVDGNVDATGFGYGGIHSAFDGAIVGYIQVKNVYWKRTLFRKRTDFGGILGITACGVTHRRENGVPFTSQGFGEQSAEAGTGAGDENHLPGIHDYPSLWRYREISWMPEKSGGYKNKFNRLTAREMKRSTANNPSVCSQMFCWDKVCSDTLFEMP